MSLILALLLTSPVLNPYAHESNSRTPNRAVIAAFFQAINHDVGPWNGTTLTVLNSHLGKAENFLSQPPDLSSVQYLAIFSAHG